MKIDHFETAYADETDVILHRGCYHDESTALVVMTEDGEPLTKLTVCLSEYDELPDIGNVFIKDWGENEGVLRALRVAEVVDQPVRSIPVGFWLGSAVAYECPLLISLEDIEEL